MSKTLVASYPTEWHALGKSPDIPRLHTPVIDPYSSSQFRRPMSSIRPNKGHRCRASQRQRRFVAWQICSDGPFSSEADPYHLYIGLFCPFAHHANLTRHLKGLQDLITISIVKPYPNLSEALTSTKTTSKQTRDTEAAIASRPSGTRSSTP